MLKHFAGRIVPKREHIACDFFAFLAVQTGLSLLHGFSEKRLVVHAEETRRDAFRKDYRNLAAFNFLGAKKFRSVFGGLACNFIDRKFVPVAAILDKVAKLLDTTPACDSTCTGRSAIRTSLVKKPRIVCDNRIITFDIATEVRDVLDFLGLCKSRLFKFDAEILHRCKV